MSVPLRRRAQADADLAQAVDRYAAEADASVALDFIDEVERVYQTISENPRIGPQTIGFEVGIPGLRSSALPKFPHVIFAMERADHVEIWRVLHSSRDPRGLLTSSRSADEPG